MNKILKQTISWTLYFALLFGLVFGVPKGLAYVLKTPYPMASISSSSMWPALKRGDLVFIKGVGHKNELEIGDIVVYKNIKGFTIHRVVRLNDNTLTTKGDANNTFDAPISYTEVVGKAVKIGDRTIRLPLVGNISLLINRPNL